MLRPLRALQPVLPCAARSLFRCKPVSHGEKYGADFALRFERDGRILSPWHDIPLVSEARPTTLVNFVCEMPRGEQGKFEINTKVENNPIMQDRKSGKLRFINYGPVLHNYGALPQTYEDPSVPQPAADNLRGDGDPLDVLDIGQQIATLGEVYEVRILGALGLVDEGECDWKLLAVRASDPHAAVYRDISDIPRDTLDGIRLWYEMYKTVDGKPRNRFLFDGKPLAREATLDIVDECHRMWRQLRGN